jgi:uncharacterized membrane protein
MGPGMAEQRSSRPPQRGGGIFIAAGVVLGSVGGAIIGQPSLGFLAGLGLGIAAAILLAFADRR